MKYDVFISYSRKDYVDANNNVIPDNVVSKVKDALKQAGISYWFDEEGIYSGDNFVEKIANNIEASHIFVFLSTENANKSSWTSKEIAYAYAYKKYIIPVRIDRSSFNKKNLFYLADIDFIDYVANPENGIVHLIESIKNYISEVKEEERRKQEEEKKRKEEERKKAEDLKQQKEQEAKRYKEAQEKLIAEIETSCKMLENDESKMELERSNLLLKAERIIDNERRETLKNKINKGGCDRQKVENEQQRLISVIKALNDEINRLKSELEVANSKPREKILVYKWTKKTWTLFAGMLLIILGTCIRSVDKPSEVSNYEWEGNSCYYPLEDQEPNCVDSVADSVEVIICD